jgi:transposase
MFLWEGIMRPRILHLHYKTVEKLRRLRKEAEQDGAYRVAKRIHAVLLNNDSKTSSQIAEILDAPLSRVSQWLHDYEKHGYEALLEGYRSGRNPKLSEQQKTMLGDIVDSGPAAYGFLSGVWTSPMVARVIEEEFGVIYHQGHVRKLLYQLGFSIQRPRRQLAKADREKQDKWHRYTYPAIKKKAEKNTQR